MKRLSLHLLSWLAPLPLPLLRALGAGLGRVLFVLARPRRHVALTNLRLCFPDLPEAERVRLFSGHSLRAGLAISAEVDERYVQKQLGHASAEMTRRYQRRRDRFRVNLTKAAGL